MLPGEVVEEVATEVAAWDESCDASSGSDSEVEASDVAAVAPVAGCAGGIGGEEEMISATAGRCVFVSLRGAFLTGALAGSPTASASTRGRLREGEPTARGDSAGEGRGLTTIDVASDASFLSMAAAWPCVGMLSHVSSLVTRWLALRLASACSCTSC